MEKQTKILIGLAVLGAAAYLYFRPKGDKGSNTKSDGSCAEGYDSFGSTGKIICEKKCDEGYEREMSIGGIGKCVKKEVTTPYPSAPPTTDGTYVFLKDTEVRGYMGGDFPSTKKFKKGDSIQAYIYKVQSGRCNQEGEMRTGEAISFEDCNKLRTNLPNGQAIDIPFNSVEKVKLASSASSSTPKDYTVKCKDGTTDVGNGVVLPCQGHGGVMGIEIFAKCMAIGC